MRCWRNGSSCIPGLGLPAQFVVASLFFRVESASMAPMRISRMRRGRSVACGLASEGVPALTHEWTAKRCLFLILGVHPGRQCPQWRQFIGDAPRA